MGSRFEDDKGPIGDWELVVMRDTTYDAEIAAAEERGRQEAAARRDWRGASRLGGVRTAAPR